MSDRLTKAMELIQQANLLPILGIAGSMVALKKNGREYCGPCPVCRAGHDRFYVIPLENYCGCRKCETSYDPVGLYAKVYGVTPHVAAKELLGIADVQRLIRRQRAEPIVQHHEEPTWHTSDWQAEARAALASASDPTEAWRGLSLETLNHYGVKMTAAKFDPRYGKNRPAMIIPWWEASVASHQIYNLKYRFTNERLGGLRYTSKGGGEPLIFGEHLLLCNKTLVVTEGEINAMSVYGAFRSDGLSDSLDVISIGGQTNSKSVDRAKLILENRGYDECLVWMDEPQKAISVAKQISESARPMCSSQGWDANDVLVNLGHEFLRILIRSAITASCSMCSGSGNLVLGELVTPCLLCKGKVVSE